MMPGSIRYGVYTLGILLVRVMSFVSEVHIKARYILHVQRLDVSLVSYL